MLNELEAILRGEDTSDVAESGYVECMEAREAKLAKRSARDIDYWLDAYAGTDPALLFEKGGDAHDFAQVLSTLTEEQRSAIDAYCKKHGLSLAQYFNTATALFIQK